MMHTMNEGSVQVRLLEIWLPLAQSENTRHRWGYTPYELEQLVLVAAPALQHTHNALAARAIFWYYHRQVPRE